MSDKTIRCIGIDPGIKNHAVSIMDITFRPRGMDVKVIKSGILKNPVFDLNTDVVAQCQLYCNEMTRIIEKYNPVMVCAERFQNRGFRAGGSQMEAVNVMLGALSCLPHFDNVQLKLVSPVVWKSAVKRHFELKEHYKLCRFPVHEFDAGLIGIYGAHVFTGRKAFTDTILDPHGLIDEIENATTSELKRERKGKYT